MEVSRCTHGQGVPANALCCSKAILINCQHFELFKVETLATILEFQFANNHHIELSDCTQYSCYLLVYQEAKLEGADVVEVFIDGMVKACCFGG